MSRIAFIPIDNRPVCFQLPLQIINMANEHELFMPDKSFLGDLTKNADVNSLFSWLNSLKNIDIFIISLDTIAYGGLISSRRCNLTIDEVKSRIDKLIDIIRNQSAETYAFSSIMRISNNNINEEEKEYWAEYGTKIFQYSYNLHEKESNKSDYEIPCDIPQNILNDYLETRKRNFEINKYYIELQKQGIFNTLVFSKDDCAQYGLNVKEAQLLEKEADNTKNIFIKTGADEIPLTLLSRAINKKKFIRIAPVYTNPESIDKISRYEDITVEKSVISQIELAGGIVSSIEDCNLIMLVNNFKDIQGELVMNASGDFFDKKSNVEPAAESGSALSIPNMPYFISDILNANGSDNNFVKTLFKNECLKEFFGYSAWNTTGNTLGCSISAALTYYGAKYPNRNAFRELQLTRFLDDWAYQANVRAEIRNDVKNLSADVLKSKMEQFKNMLFDKFEIKRVDVEYKLPWNRFFEIEITLHKKYIKLPFIDILFNE